MDDGLVTVESAFPVSETADRLAATAEGAGMRGRVLGTTNDADWIAKRHGLAEGSAPAVAAVSAGLARIVGEATAG